MCLLKSIYVLKNQRINTSQPNTKQGKGTRMSFKAVDERIKRLNLLSGISLLASVVLAIVFGLVIGLNMSPGTTSNSTTSNVNLTLEFATASRPNIDLNGLGTLVTLRPIGEFTVTSDYSFLTANATGFLTIMEPGYYTGNMLLNVTLSEGSVGGVTCFANVGVSESRFIYPPTSYVFLTSNQGNNNPPFSVTVAPFFFYQLTASVPFIPLLSCQIFDFLDPNQTFGPISLAITIVKNNGVGLLI